LSRNPRHFNSFFYATGAVIDLRHDMRMDVDHARQDNRRTFLAREGKKWSRRWLNFYFNSKSSSQTLPFSKLSNFFEGTRRRRIVTRSEAGVNGIVKCCQ